MRTGAWFLAMAAFAGADDWTRWRGAGGDGISAETGWKAQSVAAPKIRWKATLGEGHSSVSVYAKRLYTMGNVKGSDVVYCLDAESGKEAWRFAYACPKGTYPGPRATPVLEGDSVYTLGREGQACCLDAATGKVKWQKSLEKDYKAAGPNWGMAGSPLIHGNNVIYNAGMSGLALDKATGAKVWESGAGPGGYAAPVAFTLKEKECLAIFGLQDLYVVEAATGKKLHSHPWVTKFDINAADPVHVGGKLLITSGYGHGAALLDLTAGSVRPAWENLELKGHFASPIHIDGHFYGVDGNTNDGKPQLRCLEAATGKVKWTERGNGFENLTAAAGKLIAIDKKGLLVVAEAVPTGYKEIAKGLVLTARAQNWTAPVLANGLIYCRNSDGLLVCVDVR